MPSPRARTERLVVQELADETLIFDQLTHKAHCLNRVTAQVWKHCDGRNDLPAMARIVEEQAVSPPTAVGGLVLVQLALEQLSSRHLLETPAERGSAAQRRSRRQLLKQLAAAAVTLPVILTVAAPRANAAGSLVNCSGKANNSSCGSRQFCCNGVCCNTSRICGGTSPFCCFPPGFPSGVDGNECRGGMTSTCCSGRCTGDGTICADFGE